MLLLKRISAALDRAARFLAAHQLPSGEVPVCLAFDRDLAGAQHDPCVFGSALTALALRRSDSPLVQAVVARARGHIASQRRPDNTWAYWSHWFNVPSDADDTACCSIALCQAPGRPHPELRRNRRFFLRHRDSAGLFQTWFQPGWNITDSVVNANVLSYLGSTSSTRSVVDYLVSLVEEGREDDSHPYYADHASLYYSIARATRVVPALRKCCRALAGKLRMRSQPDEQDPTGFLFRAQSLSALAILGQQLIPAFGDAIIDLLERQQFGGGWPAAALYTGPAGVPRTNWYGSPELSTVVCMEALLRTASSDWRIYGERRAG